LHALTEEELDEIVSCKDQPVLEAYIEVVFKAAVLIWKYKMPVESRDAFEKQVFHPGSANEDLQRHLGMTMTQQLFDMYYSPFIHK
jgi:hypothetical protein